MILGYINLQHYLTQVKGLVVGTIITDAKDRQYRQEYAWEIQGQNLLVKRKDGYGDAVIIPSKIELDESLIHFLSL
jgi:hypothetical protein